MNFRRSLFILLSVLSSPCLGQVKEEEKRAELSPLPIVIDTSKVVYKNKILAFPLIALSTETSWVFGAGGAYIFKTSKKDSTLRTSTMPLLLLYTLKDQILAGIGANIFLPKEKYIIRFENTYSRFPDKFWGIGNDTPASAEESYTFNQFFVNPAISRKIRRNLFAGIGIEYQHVFNIKYDSGGNFEQDKVIGIYNETEYDVFGLSALITYDSRNHAYTPNKGSLFRVRYSNFNESRISDYNFQSLDIDFRKFIELKPNNILAVQYYSLMTFGDVPYRNLAMLGGSMMMRGYYQGRYRDKMIMSAQAEYRFPVVWRFGAVAFASAGQVADNLSQFNFSKMRYAAGAGVRFSVLPSENFNLRVDAAYGDKWNVYVLLTESF
jgi:hypothetical protein